MPYKDKEIKRARDRARYHEKKAAERHAIEQERKAEPASTPLDMRALALASALERAQAFRRLQRHRIGPGKLSWFSKRWQRQGKYTGDKLRGIRAKYGVSNRIVGSKDGLTLVDLIRIRDQFREIGIRPDANGRYIL